MKKQVLVTESAERMFDLMMKEERRRLYWLTPLLTVNALFHVLGIAFVMPCLALIANPTIIQDHAFLAWVYSFVGITSPLAFTIFSGVVALVLLVASNGFAAWTQFGLLRFSWGMNHTLSVRMLRTYLLRPYVFFLDQNTASLAKNILGEVKHAVKHFVVAGMSLIARGAVAMCIVGLLIVIDSVLALASVVILHRDLELSGQCGIVDSEAIAPLRIGTALARRGVSFRYPNSSTAVLEDFDLRIRPNTSVTLVRSTGAGKSTVVDLLLGLLRPEGGHLMVDGSAIDAASRLAWQKTLGYVPQGICRADDTVAANIAFGVAPKQIDMAVVRLAAQRANIHDFIENELPNGYATEIGERGVPLSGGQRQRLGIARALFEDPAVPILDEVTSALDNVTEESIFHAVNELGADKTVIVIAHRISTVRRCDAIFVLDEGRILAHGSYAELLSSSSAFRALASVDQPVVAQSA